MTRKSPFQGALAGCGLAVCWLAGACEHAKLVIKKPCLIRLRDGVAQLNVQLLAASDEAQEAKGSPGQQLTPLAATARAFRIR